MNAAKISPQDIKRLGLSAQPTDVLVQMLNREHMMVARDRSQAREDRQLILDVLKTRVSGG